MPEPWECHGFFHTEEMWQLGLDQCNAYPRSINVQATRPPWVPAKRPWPPVWTSSPKEFTLPEYKHNTMILHLLGLKHCGTNNVRTMFSSDEVMQEKWLKDICSRIEFESFLRQVHFEDYLDPCGKRFEHSVNYRPNGVPKVGLYMELNRRRCVLFRPEPVLSFDEATAKYMG